MTTWPPRRKTHGGWHVAGISIGHLEGDVPMTPDIDGEADSEKKISEKGDLIVYDVQSAFVKGSGQQDPRRSH